MCVRAEGSAKRDSGAKPARLKRNESGLGAGRGFITRRSGMHARAKRIKIGLGVGLELKFESNY